MKHDSLLTYSLTTGCIYWAKSWDVDVVWDLS